MLFNTLAAGHPQSAVDLVKTLNPRDFELLKLDIVEMEIRDAPSSANKRLPMLFKLLEDRDANPYDRVRVMELLSVMDLAEEDLDRFSQILVEDIQLLGRTKKIPSYSSEPEAAICVAPAITALSQLPHPEKHAGVVAATILPSWWVFDAAVEYLATCASLTPEQRTRHLETLVRPRFSHHGGLMNDVFTAALVHDLRGLESGMTAMATKGPEDREGPGADYGGGEFQGPKGKVYHRAREVLAFWHAPDNDTHARMWIAFVVNHPHEFLLENLDDFSVASLRQKAESALSKVPDSNRVAWTNEALQLKPMGKWYLGVRDWLQGSE